MIVAVANNDELATEVYQAQKETKRMKRKIRGTNKGCHYPLVKYVSYSFSLYYILLLLIGSNNWNYYLPVKKQCT
jgi:hypothetical protein